jgi:hypothetical protein
MITQSITRRISLLAVIAMLPASLLAGETSKRTAVDKESTELFGEMESVARDLRTHTSRLNFYTRDTQISRESHSYCIGQIKSLVNERLQPAMARLTEIQPELPSWKQDAIEQMLASARSLAANVNSAIDSRNEAGSVPIFMNQEYGEFLASMHQNATDLVNTSDAAGDYAEAHRRASEVGIKLPVQ